MKVLNYRIIVEKEKQGRNLIYVAHVPSLGLSDFGKTIDESVKNTEKAIKLYLETLKETGNPIPEPDTDEYFVTTSKVQLAV
ncbi:MAG: type II toxin-antitoxin system HicB family antitoxin [Patescibacteria group bacterium]